MSLYTDHSCISTINTLLSLQIFKARLFKRSSVITQWNTEAKAMSIPQALIKWRINALKIQIISHQQEIKACDLSISRCKHDLQIDETKKAAHQFSLKQIAKELDALTALEIENEKAKTSVSEPNLNTVQEATMYTGGVDSLEIMDDPGI
jgi:predicted  nucleic acid-binding Zn-ribbon protein